MIPNFDTDEKVLGFVTVVTDISERKASERELNARREKIADVSSRVTDAFCAFDHG